MTFPTLTDYKGAIANAPRRLRGIEALACRDDRGEPRFLAGNFAGVFKMEAPDGSTLAVKCFIRDLPALGRRYEAVARFLRAAGSPYLVTLDYHPEALFVTSRLAASADYPVVVMPWLEGRTLGAVAESLCQRRNQRALAGLTRAWARLCLDLAARGVAHGDLKHDNVLITPEGRLKLIDYDSMYLPELRDLKCTLLGGVNFQHPGRRDIHFDAGMDHFSILVILLSLRALTLAPELFERHHTSENLIFCRDDFVKPSDSPLFQHLARSNDLFVRDWTDRLARCCAQPPGPVAGIKRLLGAARKLDAVEEAPGLKWLFYQTANAAGRWLPAPGAP